MIKHFVILFLMIVVFPLYEANCQTQPYAEYVIVDGEVVFRFHDACIGKTSDQCLPIVDFEKYKLKESLAKGAPYPWTKDGWKLTKQVRKNEFELHRSLSDFNEKMDVGDKFMIDAAYWKMPYSEAITSKKGENVDLTPKSVSVNPRGNTIFNLKGFTKAKEVILTGSFNNWNEHAIKMNKTADGWKIVMEIPPGLYEYKFIADGQWMHDPATKNVVENQYGTLNSILSVGKELTFTLPGYLKAKKVILSGSFNSWNESAFKMTKTGTGWKYVLKLPPGKHYYKFIVDGDWMTDPTNKLIQHYMGGIENSVLVVKK